MKNNTDGIDTDAIEGKPEKAPKVDSTLTKGLQLLEALSASDTGKGVSELSRELDLTKSNTFRLLQTLSTLGYVRHGDNKLYSATLKAWQVGRQVIDNLNLRELAMPSMRELSNDTHETVYLAVPENLTVIYIDKIDSLRPIRSWNRIGGSAPIHCVGTGKAIIAANYASLRDVLRGKLTKYTDKTLTSLTALEADIAKTRELGYAFDAGEFRDGVVSFGAPICLPNGVAIAAIGVSVPEVNLPETGRDKIGESVAVAARGISERLARH